MRGGTQERTGDRGQAGAESSPNDLVAHVRELGITSWWDQGGGVDPTQPPTLHGPGTKTGDKRGCAAFLFLFFRSADHHIALDQ